MEQHNIMNPIESIRDRLGDKAANLLLEIRRVANTLGFESFIVGGTVRDLILDKPLKDIDVSVIGDAIMLVDEIEAQIAVVAVRHPKFRTATIKIDDLEIDIVSARSETYITPGALPQVTLAGIEHDLRRRDFSINAMAISLNEPYALVDPLEGMLDLTNGVIKVLHDNSFSDDPTRIFRMFRYSSRFGFIIGTDTVKQVSNAVTNNFITFISKERLTNEISLLLDESNFEKVIEQLLLFKVFPFPCQYRPVPEFDCESDGFKWIYLINMYDTEFQKALSDMFVWGRQTTKLVTDFVELCGVINAFDEETLNETNLERIYRLLKQTPRPIMDIYVALNPGTINTRLLEQYILYTEQRAVSIDAVELIGLGVEKQQLAEIIDMLTILRITGQIRSKSEEVSVVVQFVNG